MILFVEYLNKTIILLLVTRNNLHQLFLYKECGANFSLLEGPSHLGICIIKSSSSSSVLPYIRFLLF